MEGVSASLQVCFAAATAVFIVSCQLVSGGDGLRSSGIAGTGVAAGAAGGQGGGVNVGGGGGVGGGVGGAGGAGAAAACSNATDLFVKILGAADDQRVHDVAPTSDGGCIVVGAFDDTYALTEMPLESGPSGESQAFAIKLGPDGAVVWARRLDDDVNTNNGTPYVAALHVETGDQGDEIFVVGTSSTGAFALRLSDSGEVIWETLLISTLPVTVEETVLGGELWLTGTCGTDVTFRTNGALAGAPLQCTSGEGVVVRLARDASVDPRAVVLASQPSSPGVRPRAIAIRDALVVVALEFPSSGMLSLDGVPVPIASSLPSGGSDVVVLGYNISSLVVAFASRISSSDDVVAHALGMSSTRIIFAGGANANVALGDPDTASEVLPISEPSGFMVQYTLNGVGVAGSLQFVGDAPLMDRASVRTYAIRIEEDAQRITVAGEFGTGSVLTDGLENDTSMRQVFVATQDETGSWSPILQIGAQVSGGATGVTLTQDRAYVASTLFEGPIDVNAALEGMAMGQDVVVVSTPLSLVP